MARRRYRRVASLSTTQILVLFSCLFVVTGVIWFSEHYELTSILDFWWISVIILVLIFTMAWFIGTRKQSLQKALQIADIDNMTGIAFEQYIGRVLQSRGYAIQFTPMSGDFGVDILATKDRVTSAVQLKRYKSAVGVEAINQAVAGRGFYNANNAMVITNNYFTNAAQKLAYPNHCELIDRDTLAHWIREFQLG